MVKVIGTRGKAVDIQVLGIAAVMHRLRSAGKKIESSADLGVVKAGGFIQEEVKESIMGHRAETRSVDTGKLGNSIVVNKIKKAVVKVLPRKDIYPGGANTQDVATYLEYGTSRIQPARRHFRNTKTRNQDKIRGIIDKEIRIGRI